MPERLIDATSGDLLEEVLIVTPSPRHINSGRAIVVENLPTSSLLRFSFRLSSTFRVEEENHMYADVVSHRPTPWANLCHCSPEQLCPPSWGGVSDGSV